MKIAGNLLRLCGIDCSDVAKRDSPGAARDFVLINPRARPAFADANTEAADIIIEDNQLALALGKGELGDIFEYQLHRSPHVLGEGQGKVQRVVSRGQAWPTVRRYL